MKNIIFVLSILLCFSLLILGKIQYDNKLQGIAHEAQSSNILSEQPGVAERQDQVDSHVGLIETKEIHPELQDQLIRATNNNESLRVAFVGSNAMTAAVEGEMGWPEMVIEELNDTYGETMFDVTIFEVGNQTTHQVIESGLHNEILEFQPDVLLFEPLVLNDNNNMTIDVTLQNITTILEEINEVIPNVLVVLQPPNPIYLPNYYLEQVRELKSYAVENNYTYIDHWEAWPSITDETIRDYIEGTRPNQKGHEIWAGEVAAFFKGK